MNAERHRQFARARARQNAAARNLAVQFSGRGTFAHGLAHNHGDFLYAGQFGERRPGRPVVRIGHGQRTTPAGLRDVSLAPLAVPTRRTVVAVTIDTRFHRGRVQHLDELARYCESAMFTRNGHIAQCVRFRPSQPDDVLAHRHAALVRFSWRDVGYELGPVLGKVHAHFILTLDFTGWLHLGATRRALKDAINRDWARLPRKQGHYPEWGVWFTLSTSTKRRNYGTLSDAYKRRR